MYDKHSAFRRHTIPFIKQAETFGDSDPRDDRYTAARSCRRRNGMIHAGVLREAGYALCNDVKGPCHSLWKACRLSYCCAEAGIIPSRLTIDRVTRISEIEVPMPCHVHSSQLEFRPRVYGKRIKICTFKVFAYHCMRRSWPAFERRGGAPAPFRRPNR